MSFNYLILSWFLKENRDLPWRTTREPYFIWLSEIMLQQTRVAQGLNYYKRFVLTFPTIYDLAKAEEQEILRLWQGLGYYARARNLHFTAKDIVSNYNGKFPSSFIELKKLKGIGDYTAAAIASICFNEAQPAIDGNAYRVLSRFFNIHEDISLGTTRKIFFELGLEIIDKENPGDFNQAVMDLGATICLPKNPKCEKCPLQDSCEGLKKQTYLILPTKSKKVIIRKRYFHFIYTTDGEHILLKKRTAKDVWLHLYTFPLIEEKDSVKMKTKLSDQGISEEIEPLYSEKHILTHQYLYIKYWELNVSYDRLKQLKTLFKSTIFRIEKIDDPPLPRPIEKFLIENKIL